MAYLVFRRYAGSGPRSVEETLSAVQLELFPKLKEAGGLIRYTTLVMDDGGIASTSVYDDKQAAERGVQVAAEVVSKAQFLQGFKLDQKLEGEIARRIDHNPQTQAKYGVARIFKTSASAAQIADAMAQPPEVFAVPGRVRTFVVQLADGRVGGFSSFDSKETADKVSEVIERVRANPSAPIVKLAPDGIAEQFAGRIVNSTSTQNR
jgi:hypothetical protein